MRRVDKGWPLVSLWAAINTAHTNGIAIDKNIYNIAMIMLEMHAWCHMACIYNPTNIKQQPMFLFNFISILARCRGQLRANIEEAFRFNLCETFRVLVQSGIYHCI